MFKSRFQLFQIKRKACLARSGRPKKSIRKANWTMKLYERIDVTVLKLAHITCNSTVTESSGMKD